MWINGYKNFQLSDDNFLQSLNALNDSAWHRYHIVKSIENAPIYDIAFVLSTYLSQVSNSDFTVSTLFLIFLSLRYQFTYYKIILISSSVLFRRRFSHLSVHCIINQIIYLKTSLIGSEFD